MPICMFVEFPLNVEKFGDLVHLWVELRYTKVMLDLSSLLIIVTVHRTFHSPLTDVSSLVLNPFPLLCLSPNVYGIHGYHHRVVKSKLNAEIVFVFFEQCFFYIKLK